MGCSSSSAASGADSTGKKYAPSPDWVTAAVKKSKSERSTTLDLSMSDTRGAAPAGQAPLVEVPGACFSLAAVRVLSLANHKIRELPLELGTSMYLTELDASQNDISVLSEALCAAFASRGMLQRLILYKNSIAELPAALFDCKELQEVNVFNNRVARMPASIASSTLRELNVGSNRLTSLPDVSRCTSIVRIAAQMNALAACPPLDAIAGTLVTLQLNENKLTMFPSLGDAARLETIDLSKNAITSLPDSIGACTALVTLNMRQNAVAAIPSGIARCARLEVLNAEMNAITSVAVEVGACRALKTLLLSRNGVTRLPRSILSCPALARVTLEGCPLEAGDEDVLDILRAVKKLCAANKGFLRCDLKGQL